MGHIDYEISFGSNMLYERRSTAATAPATFGRISVVTLAMKFRLAATWNIVHERRNAAATAPATFRKDFQWRHW